MISLSLKGSDPRELSGLNQGESYIGLYVGLDDFQAGFKYLGL